MSSASKAAAVLILVLTLFTSAFAAGLPVEPRTLSEFEAVWDYAAQNSSDQVSIHYSDKQSVNTYEKYKQVTTVMSQKYRYVHPEDFNYMRLKDCSFVPDQGSRNGFTMVLSFEDLDSEVKRTYRDEAALKAKELYDEAVSKISPEMTQKERAKVFCQAITDKIYYKNDKTDLCHTAYCALTKGYTVCDGYTSLLNMLLRLDGIECEGRLGNANGNLHEWTRAKLDGQWLNIDATAYNSTLSDKYIGMTDEEISKTHKIDLSYQMQKDREAAELAMVG